MKIFSRDYLVNELGLPYDSDCVIEDTMIDKERWSIVHRLIFKDNDKAYRTYYEEPATEEQEMQPWEDEDEVECEEVIPVKVKTTIWVSPGNFIVRGEVKRAWPCVPHQGGSD